jgi:RHH-type rel operon transcriptional repressor/antitoxin RelB
MLAIRLPEQVEQRLASLAERTGRTKTFYVKEAILTHLEELEDLYLAGEVLERIKRGEERTYTFEEIKARHGLAD